MDTNINGIKKSARNSNIELLRIIVMVMIVGCHFATHGGFDFEPQEITIPRLWWNVLEMGGNFGVDVFILISGYFLIENKTLSIAPKKILKLWSQIFFYSIILFGAALFMERESLTFGSILYAFLPITFSGWWFASTYFVMFLIHPYINRALISFSKKEYQKFLLFVFLIWSIIPTLTSTTFQANPLIEFVLYYSIAGYIKRFGFRQQVSSKVWFGSWFACSVLKYLSCVFFMIMGKRYPVLLSYTLLLYGRQSVLTVFSAVSLFMSFATMKTKTNRLINEISSATFGVYLLHDSSLLREYFWNDVFHVASLQNTSLIIPYSIFIVAIVYIECTVVDLGRKYILEKPLFILIDVNICKWSEKLSKIAEFCRILVFEDDDYNN